MSEADEDQVASELAKNVRWGIGLGTPITFVFFFAILYLTGTSFGRAAATAAWTAIVGGAFYGGLTGLLKVSLKHE